VDAIIQLASQADAREDDILLDDNYALSHFLAAAKQKDKEV
jgi:hypothetical protein